METQYACSTTCDYELKDTVLREVSLKLKGYKINVNTGAIRVRITTQHLDIKPHLVLQLRSSFYVNDNAQNTTEFTLISIDSLRNYT